MTQPIDSPLDLQFPILLAYSDIIVALTDGSDLSVSLTLVTPNPYVMIGGWGPFSSTQLIGASNEGRWGCLLGNHGKGAKWLGPPDAHMCMTYQETHVIGGRSVVVQSRWYFVEKYLPHTMPTDNDAIVADIQ